MELKKPDIRIYRGDHCFKFIPRHNFDTFIDQIQLTEGELLNYLPSHAYTMHKSFEFTKKLVSIGFWVLDVAFVTYCHKMKIINKIFSNRWAMLAFKLSCVIGPFFAYLWIEKTAINEHLARLYSTVEDDYRKYKNTGDITLLNPQIKIYDIQWPQLKTENPTQANFQFMDEHNNQLKE